MLWGYHGHHKLLSQGMKCNPACRDPSVQHCHIPSWVALVTRQRTFATCPYFSMQYIHILCYAPASSAAGEIELKRTVCRLASACLIAFGMNSTDPSSLAHSPFHCLRRTLLAHSRVMSTPPAFIVKKATVCCKVFVSSLAGSAALSGVPAWLGSRYKKMLFKALFFC